MSKKITTSTQTKSSRLISAINSAFEQHEKTTLPKDAQFDFRAMLQTPYVVLENSNIGNNHIGFDMEFEIPFDDDTIPNEAEFIIYNLSKSTANKFKVGNSICMTAGYGNDKGIIFEGYIKKAHTVTEGVDSVTTIKALDGVNYKPSMSDEKTFAKGTKATTILKYLLSRLGLPIEVFSPQRDHTYDSETKIDGSISEKIKEYSEVCGVSTYVCKQRIYCRPLTEGDNLYFNVNENTGMIGSPEPFEEENSSEKYTDVIYGYDIEMILQHRMTTAGIVNLGSLNYSGEYRIKSGTHSYDGLSATTKIKCIERTETTIKEGD